MKVTTIHVKSAVLADSVLDDAYVQFTETGIEWVRPADQTDGGDKQDALNFDGCTLLPGLIDVHTHLSLGADGRPYEQMAGDSDATMVVIGVRNAGVHLRSGVTTVRDNGARNDVAFAIKSLVESGAVLGPDVLASGRPITPRGGHFHWCNGVADSAEEVAALAKELIRQGADHLKIMATGGGTASSDPTRASYSVEEMAAAVGVARAHGRRTTAHCRATEGIRRALAAQVDCIEHAEFLDDGGMIRFDEVTAESLVESTAFISPTLQAFGHYGLKELRSTVSEGRRLSPPEVQTRERLERHLEEHLRTFRRLSDIGLLTRMVFGTDAGPHITQFGDPAFGLQLMVDGGMTPLEAIRSATIIAAEAVDCKDRGVIEPGKKSDLLLVRGDPTADIGAMSEVVAVYKNGRAVPIDPPPAAALGDLTAG